MTVTKNEGAEKMEKVVSLCKRRGFVFQGSEIYGGFVGSFDYGPYGVELANNIKAVWWKAMVQSERNIVGLDSAIVTHPKVWEASGHVSGFSDPMVECLECNTRARADHLLEEINVSADEKMSIEEINNIFDANRDKLVCPKCGQKNFSAVRQFNLLAQTNLGNFSEDWSKEPTYLRGETCQGIYLNFKNVLDSTRVKVPFGIAQIGKAFRNEIAPRQYIFRKREFEQMEMQMFVSPEEEIPLYEVWKAKRMQYYIDLGFKADNLRFHEHENLVFYAKAAFDIEYNFPFGFKELEGVHARGNYDLTQHQTFSGVSMEYTDPYTNEKYIPHVIETSVGLDRTFLAVMTEFYDEDELGGETRVVLRLPKQLAPIKVAVFPLLKNRPELVAKAEAVFALVSKEMRAEFDDNGNVGKRYRRQDEIGTPYCVTIDFETLGEEKPELKDTVTVRHRDTGEQERVAIGDLIKHLI
ncbi:MAG: glycine--tRNA ligase [Parcubacteria group bacterium CG2_30_44_11]|nr:MAG: glycine--tRNA ligase [Parcubacteria group bacterium CG2_30_44_11]